MYTRIHTLFFVLLLTLSLGCEPADEAAVETAPEPNVVDVVARGLTFEMPDRIPAGWTTFRLVNSSEMTHFAVVERMPEGVGLVEQQTEVAPIFQDGMNLLNEGDADAAMAAFGELPAWFGEIEFLGGPGLTSAGETSQATVYLEPGTYLMECYVKTDGVFHSYNPSPDVYGMVYEFTVTEDTTSAVAPTPTLALTLSAENGIEVDGDITPGRHTVAVQFADQQAHENFVGHDVHLVRLEEDTDLAELQTWMDWTQPTGLETPAPAVFLGGLNEMPAGATGYFTVDLAPGRYAWIAEVPNAEEKGLMQVFTVPAAS